MVAQLNLFANLGILFVVNRPKLCNQLKFALLCVVAANIPGGREMMVASLGLKAVPEGGPVGLAADGLVGVGLVGEGLVGDGLVSEDPGLVLGLAEIEGGLLGTPSSSSSPLLI